MLLCVNSIKSLATSSWTEKKQAATAVRTNLHAVDDDSTHLFFHSLLLSIGKLCMACTRSAVITHQSTKLCKCNLIIVLTVVKFFVVGIFSLEPWINWHFSERASESLATCINYEFGKMRTNALLLSMMTMMMIMCVYVTSAIRVSLSIEKNNITIKWCGVSNFDVTVPYDTFHRYKPSLAHSFQSLLTHAVVSSLVRFHKFCMVKLFCSYMFNLAGDSMEQNTANKQCAIAQRAHFPSTYLRLFRRLDLLIYYSTERHCPFGFCHQPSLITANLIRNQSQKKKKKRRKTDDDSNLDRSSFRCNFIYFYIS